MLRTGRNLSRMFGLVAILARNDALTPIEALDPPRPVARVARAISRRRSGRSGEKFARALEAAGPSFIKLGQALSTRADVLGDDFVADLAHLRDRLPPFDGAVARQIIEDELRRPAESLFRRFDDVPVAAASIAQVHFAETSEGRPVAVKVLRPGVEHAFRRDLDLFFWLAESIEWLRPDLQRLRFVDSVSMLAESVSHEMDLRMEAAAASELAENFAADSSLHVPAVDWARTGQRVLTLERVGGLPINERDAIIAAGHQPERVLTIAAEAIFRQVFRDGFFHGDLHPGNLFIQADGRLAVVDFGIMGRLDRPTRRHLAQLLLAFLNRDYRAAADVHFAAGWVSHQHSRASFAQALRSIGEPIFDKPQHEISIARLLSHLFRVTETFGMETQPQLLLLQKTMLVAEGSGRALCPEINMWSLARPMMQEWMRDELRLDTRLREAAGAAEETIGRISEVARLLERSAGWLADGRVHLHSDELNLLRVTRAGFTWAPWLIALAAVAYAIVS
ncbi:MAG: 2-polyprenylphenol 6-hydroxylase [Rhodospirillales bacterium]